jgi:hypothetical protein
MGMGAKRFVTGFSIAALAAVMLNVIPYLWTRGAYQTDGFEVAGFPFTFRRFGGFAGTYQFHVDLLLYNIVLALAVAILFGWFCTSNEFRRLMGERRDNE